MRPERCKCHGPNLIHNPNNLIFFKKNLRCIGEQGVFGSDPAVIQTQTL
jgi:hypothetical protein